MVGKVGLLLTCLALSFAGGCDANSGGGQRPAQAHAPAQGQPTAAPAPDAAGGACGLIEASEVAAVQGARVRGLTPSDRPGGDFAASQCYYAVSSDDGLKNLSVHLEVTRGKGGAALKEFWEGRFGREERREREEGEKGEKKGEGARARDEGEEESAPPQRVEGIGEEAFWLGNPRAGALYVLKGDNMVRVSVGGADDMKTKIEKSKRLAAFALKRLT